MKEYEQDCPLCGSPAHYMLVDYNKVKYFNCERCTYYQISLMAEERLVSAPQEIKGRFSAKAKTAPDEHRLVIRIQSKLPEGSPPNAVRSPAGVWTHITELPVR